MTTEGSPNKTELYQRYCKQAEIIHHFAENLAQTLGVFHGIYDTVKELDVEGEPVAALNIVLFDLLQIMIMRVCALCDEPNGKDKDDDVRMRLLIAGLNEPRFQKFLVEKEERWREIVSYRAGPPQHITSLIEALNDQWILVTAEKEAIRRIKHYRNKALAHATTGLDAESKPIIGDIWKLSRLLLSVAKYIRLLLERDEWDYLEHASDREASGKALVLALHRDSKAAQGVD
jgi:hypothetical protein